MTKRKIKRYSESFKRQVVAEYEAGSSMPALAKKYGITGGPTIKLWIKKYAREGFRHELVRIQTAEEANRVKELEQQVQQLEQALGKVMLEKLKLESILEELEGLNGVEVKKNAPTSSGDCSKKSESGQATR
jgi:transposase-like protein